MEDKKSSKARERREAFGVNLTDRHLDLSKLQNSTIRDRESVKQQQYGQSVEIGLSSTKSLQSLQKSTGRQADKRQVQKIKRSRKHLTIIVNKREREPEVRTVSLPCIFYKSKKMRFPSEDIRESRQSEIRFQED